jgi:CRP/FNR family transcriptional regulator, cyclic AMP receptor protein
VGKDGVTVTLKLSHRLLGALVGARRPTISTAVARLSGEGRVMRAEDDAWLLRGFGPPMISSSGALLERGRDGLSTAFAA